jgi:hypothetical protein
MNLNEIYVHKSTPFLCLCKYVLKKLTLHNVNAVVRAVPPDAIGHENFDTMPSLCVSLMLPLTKAQDVRHSSHVIVC